MLLFITCALSGHAWYILCISHCFSQSIFYIVCAKIASYFINCVLCRLWLFFDGCHIKTSLFIKRPRATEHPDPLSSLWSAAKIIPFFGRPWMSFALRTEKTRSMQNCELYLFPWYVILSILWMFIFLCSIVVRKYAIEGLLPLLLCWGVLCCDP